MLQKIRLKLLKHNRSSYFFLFYRIEREKHIFSGPGFLIDSSVSSSNLLQSYWQADIGNEYSAYRQYFNRDQFKPLIKPR